MQCDKVTGILEYDNEKRDKRAKRITSGLCSRSCYTWVPNFSPLTLSYIAKQREWWMNKHKVSLEVSSCMGGSQHGSPWLLCRLLSIEKRMFPSARKTSRAMSA